MIIDSHCHLEYEPMISSLKEVIDRAIKNNVKYLLSISTTNESYERILQIVKNYKNVYGTYGIHPHESKNYKTLSSEQIIKILLLQKDIDTLSDSSSGLDELHKKIDRKGKRDNIVVVQYAGQKAGLVVDELLGEHQTVIKPLGKVFQNLKGISGATILGSGEVAMIIDVPALFGRVV